MRPRTWLMPLFLCVLLNALAPDSLGVEEATLRQRLRAGLKARTTSEFAFIDRVVVAVNSGVMSQRLVDRVFFWARRKAAEKKPRGVHKRPMVYFQPGLIELAKDHKIPF